MKKTKIICTIGPASQDKDTLRELIKAGMNVARYNFSHGSHEEHHRKHENITELNAEMGTFVASLMDTKGPEIRLKDFADKKVELEIGQKFALTTEDIMGTKERVSITYKNLKNDVEVGGAILIDDGLIQLVIDEITDTDIICTVQNSGPVSDKKGVNVPGASLSMPYISEQDRSDIIFGCEKGYDYLAASFVRNKEDVLAVRKLIEDNNGTMKIISKIENMQGIHNLEEILEVSDGIMVARGDMGVEVPMEDVPSIQKQMIKLAVAHGKQVITATQMLESMIKNPRPTRAEVTDVANAIYDGTTAIMLSGESASGKYPVEAVQTMAKIAERTERDIDYAARMRKTKERGLMDVTTAISQSTCNTANYIAAKAIITVTISGNTARSISRYKPDRPIIAFSTDDQACRQLNLAWGVIPKKIEMEQSTDNLIHSAVTKAKESGLVEAGDHIVFSSGYPLGVPGNTNVIRAIQVD
jgi:pyruvate kinase